MIWNEDRCGESLGRMSRIGSFKGIKISQQDSRSPSTGFLANAHLRYPGMSSKGDI